MLIIEVMKAGFLSTGYLRAVVRSKMNDLASFVKLKEFCVTNF